MKYGIDRDDVDAILEDLHRKENKYKIGKVKKPTPIEYDRELLKLALSMSPPIEPCENCGFPCVKSMCCTYCDA